VGCGNKKKSPLPFSKGGIIEGKIGEIVENFLVPRSHAPAWECSIAVG